MEAFSLLLEVLVAKVVKWNVMQAFHVLPVNKTSSFAVNHRLVPVKKDREAVIQKLLFQNR
jgi:hypothetical protein